MEELKDYLMAQESGIEKFDDVLFHRFVERVMIQSMAEVAFLFKVGAEVRGAGDNLNELPVSI